MLTDKFDEIISNYMNNGQNREAAEFANETMSHIGLVLSGMYHSRGELDAAIEVLKSIVKIFDAGNSCEWIVNHRFCNPAVYSNLTFLLNAKGEFEEALKWSEGGFYIQTNDWHYNRGVAFRNLGSLKESADSFRRAISLKFDDPISHYHLSDVLFAQGEFEEAFKEEQWRFKALSRFRKFRKRYAMPDWNGEPLEKKTILVFNELGFGDAFQFCRYLRFLKEQGARVIFEVHPDLVSIFNDFQWADYIFEFEENNNFFPSHDYVVSLASLPMFFDPNLEKTECEPYIFVKNPSNILKATNKLKIGIVWAGSKWHDGDRYRSCPLRYFKPISKIPHVQLHSLQKGEMKRTWAIGQNRVCQGNDEIEVVDLLANSEEVRYIDLSESLSSFYNTASVIKQLDLVISVDTAVAHLAGAMGRPVWLIIPWAHEWRWLKRWYPTMTVFRQESKGNWENLIEKLAEKLINRNSII